MSAEEQSKQENIDSLVEHTEQVLQSELDGWVQQMQNSLAELRKGQEPTPEKEENGEPREAAPPGQKPPAAPPVPGDELLKGKAGGNGKPVAETVAVQQPGGGGKVSLPKPDETSVQPPDNAGGADAVQGGTQTDGDVGKDSSSANRTDEDKS